MVRGGKRDGAGRKRLPDEIKKHKVNFWITWEEKEKNKRVYKTNQKRVLTALFY